jgi:tyrosyl-tRNA synthetase
MIKQSAAVIDGTKLDDPHAEITPKDGMVIRVGKRKFARLKVNS